MYETWKDKEKGMELANCGIQSVFLQQQSKYKVMFVPHYKQKWNWMEWKVKKRKFISLKWV